MLEDDFALLDTRPDTLAALLRLMNEPIFSEKRPEPFPTMWGASNDLPEHPAGPRWLRRQRARQQRGKK